VRPGQWPKNIVVVPLALLGAARLTGAAALDMVQAVLAFTVASSLTYLMNDVSDRHRDRRHPEKRRRPIAAGRVTAGEAAALAAALLVLLAGLIAADALLGALAVGVWWPVPAYLALNVAYSRGLKHVPLLDVLVVATGFVLRLVQGGLVLGEPVPSWLALAVFAVCLLLILGKRRHEVLVGGVSHRPSLRGYTLPLLDQLLTVTAVLTATSCLLFLHGDPMFGGSAPLVTVLSAPFLLFGLARYLQLVIVDLGGGNPARALLRDRATLANAVAWGALLGLCALFAGGG
jgi:4-hydroxybenzoate polyprenyltransferase